MSCGIAEYNGWDSKSKFDAFFDRAVLIAGQISFCFFERFKQTEKTTVLRGAGFCPYNQDLLQTEEYNRKVL